MSDDVNLFLKENSWFVFDAVSFDLSKSQFSTLDKYIPVFRPSKDISSSGFIGEQTLDGCLINYLYAVTFSKIFNYPYGIMRIRLPNIYQSTICNPTSFIL